MFVQFVGVRASLRLQLRLNASEIEIFQRLNGKHQGMTSQRLSPSLQAACGCISVYLSGPVQSCQYTHCDDPRTHCVAFVCEAVEDEWRAAARKKRWGMKRSESGSMLQEQKDWHWLFCSADALLRLARFSCSPDQHLCIDPAGHIFPRCFDGAHPMGRVIVNVPRTELIHPVSEATLPSRVLLRATRSPFQSVKSIH